MISDLILPGRTVPLICCKLPVESHLSGEDSLATMSTSLDWQCSRRLADCNKYMLENEIECDVAFTLTEENGCQHRLRAHRFVLISRSPVFFAMLSGPLAEKGQVIRITDISLETFKHLLRFLYEDDVKLTEESVFHVLYAAKKYLVTSLSAKCTEYLRCILSPENVCSFLENSFLIEEDPELLANCLDVVSRSSEQVFRSEAFYRTSPQALCRVLSVQRLSVREIDVFRSCVRWARRKCSEADLDQTGANQRLMLGDAIRCLHLPAVSLRDFRRVVVPTEILSAEEENLIFRHLLDAGSDDQRLDALPFPTEGRERIQNRCSLSYDGFARHVTSYPTTLIRGTPQRSRWHVSICTDRAIQLREIGFLGRFKGTLSVSQNDIRKMDISCDGHMTELKLGDDDDGGLSLDAGLFTIATEPPFSYVGDYYAKGIGRDVMTTVCDQEKITIVVKELSTMCFLSYFTFVLTEQMHFVENYFDDV